MTKKQQVLNVATSPLGTAALLLRDEHVTKIRAAVTQANRATFSVELDAIEDNLNNSPCPSDLTGAGFRKVFQSVIKDYFSRKPTGPFNYLLDKLLNIDNAKYSNSVGISHWTANNYYWPNADGSYNNYPASLISYKLRSPDDRFILEYELVREHSYNRYAAPSRLFGLRMRVSDTLTDKSYRCEDVPNIKRKIDSSVDSNDAYTVLFRSLFNDLMNAVNNQSVCFLHKMFEDARNAAALYDVYR